jgi:hypothetical protein
MLLGSLIIRTPSKRTTMIPFPTKQTAVQLCPMHNPGSSPQTCPNLLAITNTCRHIHAETSLLVFSLNIFDAVDNIETFTEVARWSLSTKQQDAVTALRVDIRDAYHITGDGLDELFNDPEDKWTWVVTNLEFRYALRLFRG